MARKKKRKRLLDLEFDRPRLNISDDTKQSIVAVILIALSVLFTLSLVNLAGTIGVYLDTGLTLALGVLRWLAPILMLTLGYFLLRPAKYELTFSNYLGLFMILFGLPGLLHLLSHNQDLVAAAKSGMGGGFIGLSLSYLFHTLMGFWATLVLLLAVLLIGLFLLFNTSFSDLSEKTGRLTGKLGSRSEERKIQRAIAMKEQQSEEDDEGFESHEMEEDEDEPDYQDEPDEEEIEDEEEETEEDKALSTGVKRFKQIKIDMPFELLTGKTGTPSGGDIEANKLIIKKTLANFNINVVMGDSQVGPTVTQYTLKPPEGVRLSKITGLTDNIALALAAHPIRVEAPIPGKSLVGIEVPNAAKAIVPIKDVLGSDQFKKRDSSLMLGLGIDVMGKAWLADLKKMPHLLIAGSTGSGKSVMINSVLISLLFQNGPGSLKFILVDPKRVELTMYNGIPHLLTPVITDSKKTLNALRWAVGEMERRFEVLSQAHKRNIEAYNAEMPDKIPYIVFVIDELADLMAASAAEVEAAIIRLAQMARAVGIHLILATQRPSVDVITGLIKANITSRIAFSVASLVDSRTILDMAGAEKLLGRGDMLYISAELGKPKRLQGAFTSDDEIKNIINHLKKQAEPEYISEVTEKQSSGGSFSGGDSSDDGGDELLNDAKQVILEAKKASASLLQRRLRVGYARAARLLDLLEERGYIGPSDGAKPREILLEKLQHDTMGSPPEEDEGEPDYEDDNDDDQDYEDDQEEEEDEEFGDQEEEEEYHDKKANRV